MGTVNMPECNDAFTAEFCAKLKTDLKTDDITCSCAAGSVVLTGFIVTPADPAVAAVLMAEVGKIFESTAAAQEFINAVAATAQVPAPQVTTVSTDIAESAATVASGMNFAAKLMVSLFVIG